MKTLWFSIFTLVVSLIVFFLVLKQHGYSEDLEKGEIWKCENACLPLTDDFPAEVKAMLTVKRDGKEVRCMSRIELIRALQIFFDTLENKPDHKWSQRKLEWKK